MRPLLVASTLTLLITACHSDDGKHVDPADASTQTEQHPSTASDAAVGFDASKVDASTSATDLPVDDAATSTAINTTTVLDAGHDDASVTLGSPDGGAPAQAWTTCDTRFECTSIDVPLDYDDATAGSLQIAVRRLATTSPTRIGSLLINPGGPGASAIDFLTEWVEQGGVDDALLEHFDLVAFDPRGVGASTPLACHSTLQKLYATDPDPDSEAEWQALIAAEQTFADECKQKNAVLSAHMTTPDVARDMDRVRSALGEDKLSYLGFSYGTLIGAWYAELFPAHVRALVLDGPLDPKLSSLEISLQQAKGFELSLAHYFSWCTGKPTRCAWTGGDDPATAFAQLRASVETAPIPSATADRPLGPGEFTTGVGTPLYGTEDDWSSLSDALLAAVQGDGSGLVDLTDFYLSRNDDGSYPNEEEAYDAVMCTDRPTPSVADVRAQAATFAAAAPHFGVADLAAWLVCSDWSAQGKALPPPVGQGAAPILVVGSTGDPATPYAWAEALAQELASGLLLTRHGEGHTAYQMGDACIDSAIESYLIAPSMQTATCLGTDAPASAVGGALPRVAPAARTALRLR